MAAGDSGQRPGKKLMNRSKYSIRSILRSSFAARPAVGWTCVAAVICLAGVSHAAPTDKPIQTFLSNHCYDCHSGDNIKGGLDLSKLGTDLSQVGTLAKWVRIHDRVAAGEMPPERKAKAAEPHKPAFLAALSSTLTTASSTHAHTVMRRLNRVEYENTLRDLLGVRTELQGFLPEDGKAHGFDNIGEALDLSPVQIQRYMDAAGKALDDAVSRERPESKTVLATFETTRNAQFIGKDWLKRADGALVFFTEGGYPSIRPDFKAPVDGKYRFSISGYGYQTPRPIVFALYLGPEFSGGETLSGYYQLDPDKPGTVVVEAYVRRNDTMRLMPQDLPQGQELKKAGVEAYKGPGLAITKIEIEGPIAEEFPSRGHKLRYGDLLAEDTGPAKERGKKNYRPKYEVLSKNAEADIARLLPKFVEAAFRRPVTPTDVAPFVELGRAELKSGSSFDIALRTAQIAVLCAPEFLYLLETPGRLDDYAIASRLSYMIWGSTPDAALLDAAAKKQLATPAGLRAQTDRLLADPRAERFTKNFTGQWLNLREIDFTTPDKQLYPEFDGHLKLAMVRETEMFFDEVLKKNLSLLNFIDSDWTIVNERLARHYGIEGVAGVEMRKVPLKPEHHRGGLLTHASVLKVSANGTTTSPVVRGAWVLERILGFTPPPPPPGVPGVEPDIRGATTLRQQLDKHRSLESCNSCHKVIDPPGFALENYDVMGGWRENYRSLGKQFPAPKPGRLPDGRYLNWRIGPAVDATGVTADGKPFTGLAEYKQILLADKNRLTAALVEKVATYATGRGMGFSDRPAVDRIAKAVATKNYGFRDLVHEVIQSDIFRSK